MIGPSVITRVLVKGSQEGQSQRRRCNHGSRGPNDAIAAFTDGRGPQAKAYGLLLEGGNCEN